MSDQSQKLKQMNLEIQNERACLKAESVLLRERKKALKERENEYLSLSLLEFEGTTETTTDDTSEKSIALRESLRNSQPKLHVSFQ